MRLRAFTIRIQAEGKKTEKYIKMNDTFIDSMSILYEKIISSL